MYADLPEEQSESQNVYFAVVCFNSLITLIINLYFVWWNFNTINIKTALSTKIAIAYHAIYMLAVNEWNFYSGTLFWYRWIGLHLAFTDDRTLHVILYISR